MNYQSITIFNTGKPYSAEGQIIGAALLDDGSIIFYDVTRMICGSIDGEARQKLTSFKAFVETEYLNNRYTGISFSEVDFLAKKISALISGFKPLIRQSYSEI